MIKLMMTIFILLASVGAALISNEFIHKEGQGEYIGNGTTIWKKDGQLHRESGPAAINKDGSFKYYINGEVSRIDGPAVFNSETGSKEWWLNGKRHRIGGPAIEFKNGVEIYFVDGIRQNQPNNP